MDLNARPTRNFWSIFTCCHKSSDDDENVANPMKLSATNNYAFVPMKLLDAKIMGDMTPSADANTPTTVATADFSFETQDSKLDTIIEDDNIFEDDISEVATQEADEPIIDCDDKQFDFNEQDASFIYENMTKVAEQQGGDDGEKPDIMASFLTEEDEDTMTTEDETATQSGAVEFYHFFIFMIFRHIFGQLLLRGNKQAHSWKRLFLLTNEENNQDSDDKQYEDRLRSLKLSDEGECEAYPSLSDVPTIPEDEILL